MESFSIGTIDIIIVVVYLLFIIWWGVKNGKSSDAQSYFLAGRSMPWWVVGLSLFAASISSTTLIGQSGDAYDTGLAVFNYNLTGIVVMVFFAVFLLPLYIRSKVFTIPEFLEKRFDKRSRYYFSAICIIGNIFLDAAGALYAAALIIKLVLPEADLQMIIIVFAIIAAVLILVEVFRYGICKTSSMTLKVTIPENLNYIGLFDDILAQDTTSWHLKRVKTTNFGSLFELIYSIQLKNDVDQKKFMDEIRKRNGNLTVILSLYRYEDQVYDK